MVFSVDVRSVIISLLLFLFSKFIAVNSDIISSDNALKDTKVIMISSIFRHGDRNADPEEMAVFPNSIYNESIYVPSGLGDLTNVGKVRSYASGQYLRRRYNDLLSPLYMADQIRMRTTDYDRTKMTATLVYAGLYPPQGPQLWNSYLNWQPIPYDTPPPADDYLMPFSTCLQYKARNNARNSDLDVIKVFNSYRVIITELSIYTGYEITKLKTVILLYGALLGQVGVGKELPNWAVKHLPKIKEMNDIGLPLVYFGTDEMITFAAGPLLNEMLTNMRSAAESGTPIRRAYLYSAHDFNVGAIMTAIGIDVKHRPQFSAMFTLELRKNVSSGEFGAVAMYTRDPGEEPELLLLPGCPEVFCPLNIFAKLASKYTITEEKYFKLCIPSSD